MPTVTDTNRYAVVVCPRCKHAKGVDRAAASTTCGRCGKRHDTEGLRIFYETDDPELLREAVGAVEAKLMGGDAALIDVRALAEEIERHRGADRERVVPPPDADEESLVQYAASAAAGIQSMQKRCDAIMDALDETVPDGFTEDQLTAAFVAAGLPAERAESEMRRAFVQDELYEPRPGRFKRFRA